MKFSVKTAALTALAACVLTAGCMESQAKVGDTAADFSLKNLDGQSVSLNQELKTRKAVLLNFWATWCPPCREEIPGLISLQKKYGGDAFTILGVDVGESQVKVANFVKKVGINYPVLLDSDQAVGEMYRVVGIPTSYLVASDGRILGEYHAYTPELVEDVENAIK